MSQRIGFFISFLVLMASCTHVPARSEEDYYRYVETRVGMAGQGEAEKETRELFCPSERLRSEDPQYWSLDDLSGRLQRKDCLQIVCRYRGGLRSKCISQGDDALRAKLESRRQGIQ